MSVDCIREVGDGEKDFAKRTLWDATLHDENGKPLSWSTGLIKSVTLPKITFTVEDILNGANKAYASWKLPDSISLNIWETSDHQVEKYFDEWMLGKKDKSGKTQQGTGVFNQDTGAFQVAKAGVLYRNLTVRTFYYDVSKERQNINVQENTSSFMPTTVMKKDYKKFDVHLVKKQQPIPLLDKFVSAAQGIAGQAIARFPASNITAAIIPPIVIPPPMMTVPVPSLAALNPSVATTMQTGKMKIAKKDKKVVGDKSKQGNVKEVTTSLVTYKVAIESYDVGTYDYSSGEGVSYSVTLAVCGIKTEHDT